MNKGAEKQKQKCGQTVPKGQPLPPNPKPLLRIGSAALAVALVMSLAFSTAPYLHGFFNATQNVVSRNVTAANEEGLVVMGDTVMPNVYKADDTLDVYSTSSPYEIFVSDTWIQSAPALSGAFLTPDTASRTLPQPPLHLSCQARWKQPSCNCQPA